MKIKKFAAALRCMARPGVYITMADAMPVDVADRKVSYITAMAALTKALCMHLTAALIAGDLTTAQMQTLLGQIAARAQADAAVMGPLWTAQHHKK